MTVSGGSLGKKVATETKHIYTYTNTYTPRKNFRKSIRSFFLKTSSSGRKRVRWGSVNEFNPPHLELTGSIEKREWRVEGDQWNEEGRRRRGEWRRFEPVFRTLVLGASWLERRSETRLTVTRREVRNFRMPSSSSAKVKVKIKKRRRVKVDTRLKINNHFPRGATLSSPPSFLTQNPLRA